ncbi:hypothetical protein OS493_014827 [Desmophyllum pertusum]|uniref:Uncharacterized protein n=1 Tax=Desmophyllum pertusum TaxID=174260 RepID=A0A9X0CGT8_9CNID|nr:hypothetical protein OS493_014827 [Desmophyllum pertusum]
MLRRSDRFFIRRLTAVSLQYGTNPGVFNASQYFGNSSPKKSQQDSFWDQQSGSVNHSSGSANSTAAVDPFMTNVQNEFDGWDEWPEDQEFFGNETSHQNHVGPYYDSGSAPGINAGYNNSQLVVPEHSHYNQEDLSESSNSSSVESSPRGMDPELNAWVEEETTPYAFSKYPPPAVVSSHQTIAPQTAASQNSAAGFFDHYFNGDTNGPQSDAGAQSSTSHERTYASVCQAGMPVAPSQDVDYTPNQDYYQDWLTPPTSQAASAPELTDPQDNQLAAETWSREPELGSWSPVFNHEDNSFAGNQQHAPESTVPQIDESTWTNTSSTFEHWSGVGFDATTQQQVHVPPSSTAEPGKGFDSVSHGAEAPPAPSHLQSFDDDAQMYGHDDELNSSSLLFNHDNNSFANNQQGVSEPSVPQIDESTWTNPSSNFQPSLGFDSTMQQEVPPSQLFADGAKEEMENPNAQMSSHDLETHPSFYNEMPAVADSQSGLFAVNKGHYNHDTNKTPQLYQPEIVPVPLFGASAGSLQADPFAVDSTRQNNSLPEQAPGSHFNFFDNVQPEASEENLSEILGNLQPGAFPAFPVKADDDSNLEAPSQEPSEGFPPSMVPPSFQPPVTQVSVQQAEPSQYMVEDVPTDLNAHQLEHDQLPSDDKPLADSFGHVPSVDSPSGIFKPNSAVEPMQPHSLVATTAPPLEETPSGLSNQALLLNKCNHLLRWSPVCQMRASLLNRSHCQRQYSRQVESMGLQWMVQLLIPVKAI